MRAQAEALSARRTDTPPSAVSAGGIAVGQVECCDTLFTGERPSPLLYPHICEPECRRGGAGGLEGGPFRPTTFPLPEASPRPRGDLGVLERREDQPSRRGAHKSLGVSYKRPGGRANP